MLTRQQIFDRVLGHIRKQGKPSIRHRACLYRGPDDTSCAVGCLIPDSHYSESFDNGEITDCSSVYGLVGKSEDFKLALAAGGLDHQDPDVLSLLYELQKRHDGASRAGPAFLEVFELGAQGLAIEQGLTYTPQGVPA